jgi:hypothetical protein
MAAPTTIRVATAIMEQNAFLAIVELPDNRRGSPSLILSVGILEEKYVWIDTGRLVGVQGVGPAFAESGTQLTRTTAERNQFRHHILGGSYEISVFIATSAPAS